MSAGISLSTLGSVVGIATGIKALTSSSGGGSGGTGTPAQATSAAQQVTDPFVQYRANLGALYSGALTQGSTADITKMPGYSQYKTGVMDPALEASKRSAAASGMMRSGNEEIALQDISQRGYYGFMTDYLNRLAQGSGATTLPSQSQSIQQGNLAAQGQMQALGGIVQGIGQLYGASQQGSTGAGSYSIPSSFGEVVNPYETTGQYGP